MKNKTIFVFLLILCAVFYTFNSFPNANAAISFFGSSTCTTDGATTCSLSVGTGTNRLLIVSLHESVTGSSITPRATAVTVGGNAMTKVKTMTGSGSSLSTADEIWEITQSAGLGSGVQSLTVTWSSTPTYSTIGMFSFAGVDQTNPISTSNINATNGTASTRPHIETTVTPTHPTSWVIATAQNPNSVTGPSNTGVYTDVGDSGGQFYSSAQYNPSIKLGNATKIYWNPTGNVLYGYSTIGFEIFPVLPTSPTLNSANTQSSTSIKPSWSSVSGATWYLVYRELTSNGVFTKITNTTQTSFTDTGLTKGSNYKYEIYSGNSDGTSASPSNIVGNYTYQDPPTSLSASLETTTSTMVSFVLPSGNVTSFKIQNSTGTCNMWNTVTSDTITNASNYNFTGMTPNMSHCVRIFTIFGKGTSMQGLSSASSILNFTTVPSAPTNLLSSGSTSSSVGLIWSESGNATTGFMIERSTNNSTFTTIKANTGNATGKYTDITVAAGTTYYYRVSAINSAGTGIASSVLSITTSGTTQTPPPPSTGSSGGSGSSDTLGGTTKIITTSTGPLSFSLTDSSLKLQITETATGKIGVTWNDNKPLTISDIKIDDSPLSIVFPQTPFNLTGTGGVSNNFISYNLKVPNTYCTTVIKQNCVDKIIYTIPVHITFSQDGGSTVETANIIADLKNDNTTALYVTYGFAVVGLVGIVGAGIHANRKGNSKPNSFKKKKENGFQSKIKKDEKSISNKIKRFS